MPADKLIFKDAELARDSIMASQKKEIEQLYKNWADEVSAKALKYGGKETASAAVQQMQMKQLERQLKASSDIMSKEIENKIKQNMYIMSDTVYQVNSSWLKGLGIEKSKIDISFTTVNNLTVNRIVTGQVYEGGWNLSKAIWGDNQKTLQDIYTVVAKGVAQNVPIADIAKQLKDYVNPVKQMMWNKVAKDGAKIYKQKVDYASQRLARTLVQHSYQQSFIAATQKNPFILSYRWDANGSRVCELCKARSGMIFSKDDLPMDHPNGMCTMEPVVSPTMKTDLANWFNGEDGDYPAIDKFAENFGYKAGAKPIAGITEKSFVDKVGKSKMKQASWYNSLSKVDQSTAKLLKTQSGKTWEKWYADTIALDAPIETATSTLETTFFKKYGYSAKTLPDDFAEWSHALTSSDKTKIFEMLDIVGDAHPFQKIEVWYNEQLAMMAKTTKVETKIVTVSNVSSKVDDVLNIFKAGKIDISVIDDYSVNEIMNTLSIEQLKSLKVATGKKFYEDSIKEAINILHPTTGKAKIKETIIKTTTNAKKTASELAEKIKLVTQERRDKGLWFKKVEVADAELRPKAGEVWNTLNATQKKGLFEYTKGSGFMNRPLRGYDGDWSDFKGVGKVSLNNEKQDGEKLINAMTEAINKSTYDNDMWLQRGVGRSGTEAFLGLEKGAIRNSTQEELEEMLIGKVVTDEAFLSTGVAKGYGFSGDILNIFAPSGTKMSYVEPFSYYGNGAQSVKWDGIEKQSSIGHEAEMIIQRGTTYVVKKVEKRGSDIFFDLDIIDQI